MFTSVNKRQFSVPVTKMFTILNIYNSKLALLRRILNIKTTFSMLKAHAQAKIIKKSVILFWLLDMTI